MRYRGGGKRAGKGRTSFHRLPINMAAWTRIGIGFVKTLFMTCAWRKLLEQPLILLAQRSSVQFF
jgi:hypothetical protein